MKDILKIVETEQFWIIVCVSLLWKSMVPQNSLITNFLQNIFLCVQQNKHIHTGLEILESEEMMTELSFLGELSL